MANKKRPANAFTSGNQPTPGNRRGKADRTKLLDAYEDETGKSETDLYREVIKKAFVDNDKEMYQFVISRIMREAKSTLPTHQFQYNANDPYHVKAETILQAQADGLIPPDAAEKYINNIKTVATILEQTEIAKRLEQLEEILKNLLNK